MKRLLLAVLVASAIAAFLVVGGLLVCMLFCCGPLFTGNGSSGSDDGKISAALAGRNAVRAAIITPSTADFPWTDDFMNRVGDSWRIRSHFDTQDAFGAMIRHQYECMVTRTADDTWECTWLTIDGEEIF